MILDERNEFADATALGTSGTGRQLVGDVIDLGATRAIGEGETIEVVITVDTAVTSAGAATVDFEVASDAQAAVATDGTATTHGSTGAIGKATLIAGYKTRIKINANSAERYIGLIANVGTAALTAGSVSAGIAATVSGWTAYADATN